MAASIQGCGLDIKPYVVGVSESFPGRGDSTVRNDADAGSTSSTARRPGVRTNLTINTDFAQTEVDQRLVNLTRFPTFFPERRDFFLDGSTFFDFQSNAAAGNSLLPFFSRRIGLDANGDPQKIEVGGKLGGQFGTNDVGALYVRTGEEGEHRRRGFRGPARQAPDVPSVVRRRPVHRPARPRNRTPARGTRSAPISCSPRRRSAARTT